MGQVFIQSYTTKNPISMIGLEAGVCWGSDLTDYRKNYQRGIDCLSSQHGRTLEFPDVYMVLSGYSARMIREWYTHIGGMPTRLQASTRYIDYEHGFSYVTPPSIQGDAEANRVYARMMRELQLGLSELDSLGIPREDSALGLPIGMETQIVCKHNLRNLIDMSHTRLCKRAYHEYRKAFGDMMEALSEYSGEWAYIVENYFVPKCQYLGKCPEKHGCGLAQSKEAQSDG